MATSTTTPSALSTSPTAVERLRSLHDSPGPYASVFLPCGENAQTGPHEAFASNRAILAEAGATDEALDAIAARLTIPVPAHCGGWAIYAAADGSTAADFAPEGPAQPFMHVGDLPVSAPLLEWDQWRVAHAALSMTANGSEIVLFVPGREPWIVPAAPEPHELAAQCRQLAHDYGLRLIVIGSPEASSRGLADRLTSVVPVHTRVVELAESDTVDADTFSNGVVRHVADVVARDTVRALEDFRFLDAGGRAVEGTTATFDCLANGRGETLLVHDDPHDPATASFGAIATQVSGDSGRFPNVARRADVAIWSAISQGLDIRVIPTTGTNGPTDNLGLTLAQPVAATAADEA